MMHLVENCFQRFTLDGRILQWDCHNLRQKAVAVLDLERKKQTQWKPTSMLLLLFIESHLSFFDLLSCPYLKIPFRFIQYKIVNHDFEMFDRNVINGF